MHAHLVTIQVYRENLDSFIAAIREHARVSLENEPAMLRYDVVQELEEPTRFHVYEVFVDEAGYWAHDQSAHNQKWRETVKDWRPPVVDSNNIWCNTVCPPDSTWHK